MNDDTFTPALWLFGLLIGALLGYVELPRLQRPLPFNGPWWWLVPLALINAGLMYCVIVSENSYGYLLFVPIPVIPAVYILLKVGVYFAMQRFTGIPVNSPWLVAFLSFFFHAVVAIAAYAGFSSINPTLDHLKQAIHDQRNSSLELMLWISVKSDNMTILMNEAIDDHNDNAVGRLIFHGADPRKEYRLGEANYETRWRLVKWMLDRGLTPEEIGNQFFMEMAVSRGVADLEYFLKKGFDPAKSADVICLVLDEHPRPNNRDEVQAQQDVILLLLKHGADINGGCEAKFPAIYTLLFHRADWSPMLTFLIEHGANINFPSPGALYPRDSEELPKGLTPLMLAVITKRPEYVAILAQHGADKTIRDTKGFSALDYARKLKSDDATLQLLQ